MLFACEEDSAIEMKKGSGSTKDLLIGDWVYQSLIIAGDTLNFPEHNFEPENLSGAGDLFHIRWRWFRYFADGTYAFQKDVGAELGIGMGMNYQPIFGSWEINDLGNTLIHNRLEPFTTPYELISIDESTLIREYERVIQITSDPIQWPLGETVVYREIFMRRE